MKGTLTKFEGIVLHAIRYTDSSVILHVFTKGTGRQAYMLRGLRGKKNNKTALIQPLTLVSFSCLLRNSQSLSAITQIERTEVLTSIPFDVIKSTLAMFTAEFLHRGIPEHYVNDQMYDYLNHAIQWLDHSESPINFHLHFLLQMSLFMGYYPESSHHSEALPYFDLREGQFSQIKPEHPDFEDGKPAQDIQRILGMKFDELMTCRFLNTERRNMIKTLINFHQIHTPGLQKLQSHEVLQSIFE